MVMAELDMTLSFHERQEPATASMASRDDVATFSARVDSFPPTRFMGSKSKLLKEIWAVTRELQFDTVVDLFAGTGIVGYMYKCHQKRVISNDQMAMSSVATMAMIENSTTVLSRKESESLIRPRPGADDFVRRTFGDLYFDEEDSETIDFIRTNILALRNPQKKAIARAALIRACMKKRPRGIFTYTGARYNDGRADLKLTIAAHFLDAVEAVNAAVFDNGTHCKSLHGDAMALDFPEGSLIYIDPPYWSPLSDNDYVRRYHFVEGLARDWQGVEIQSHTKTKKFKAYETPFKTRQGAEDALELLIRKARKNPIVISYSSNSEPGPNVIMAMLKGGKSNAKIVPLKHKYSFGNQGHLNGEVKNSVEEYLFVGW